MKDCLKVSGYVELRLNGKLICSGKNIVVTDGQEIISKILSAVGATRPTHFAVGDGTTAVSLSNIALASELTGSRTIFTTDTASGSQVVYGATITAAAGWTVSEVGIFNASSGGIMFARFLTPSFEMDTGDDLKITWTLTIGG